MQAGEDRSAPSSVDLMSRSELLAVVREMQAHADEVAKRWVSFFKSFCGLVHFFHLFVGGCMRRRR